MNWKKNLNITEDTVAIRIHPMATKAGSEQYGNGYSVRYDEMSGYCVLQEHPSIQYLPLNGTQAL